MKLHENCQLTPRNEELVAPLILYNSEESIRDEYWPFCRSLFFHNSVTKYRLLNFSYSSKAVETRPVNINIAGWIFPWRTFHMYGS